LDGPPDIEFELTVDAIGGVLAVAVCGELVAGSHEPLRECLEQAVRGGRPVVLDLTDTIALDAEGIRTLLEAHTRLARRLRIVGERGGPVHAALKRAGVAHVLALHASRAAALAAATGR
jgi:anti-anti-sigma regulatory factor